MLREVATLPEPIPCSLDQLTQRRNRAQVGGAEPPAPKPARIYSYSRHEAVDSLEN